MKLSMLFELAVALSWDRVILLSTHLTTSWTWMEIVASEILSRHSA